MTNETKTAPAGELMDTQIIEVAGVFALDALGITNTLRIARAIIAADRALVKRSGTQGTDENVRMLEMANLIAASACPEEESRLEVAYAIARHLRLDWPAAQLDTFAERELRRGDVAMPVVAWRKEFETLVALASYTDFSSEAALSLGWESLVKQSDAQAALDKKDSEIEQKDSTIFSEKDLNQRLLAMHSDAWRALADRGLLNGGKPLAESILRLPHFEFLKSFNAGCDAISSIAAHLNIDMDPDDAGSGEIIGAIDALRADLDDARLRCDAAISVGCAALELILKATKMNKTAGATTSGFFDAQSVIAAKDAEIAHILAASRYTCDLCTQALDSVRELTAERDALLKDAERYRHVRDGGNSDYRICQYLVAAHGFVQLRCDPAYADKLIDAAMTKEPS